MIGKARLLAEAKAIEDAQSKRKQKPIGGESWTEKQLERHCSSHKPHPAFSEAIIREGDLTAGRFQLAQVQALGLIGFLDSRSHSQVDKAFIRLIRHEAVTKLDTARRSLVPNSGQLFPIIIAFLVVMLPSQIDDTFIWV
ncbi:unnamed protein product [Fraxinus pennsylvanica]|uniref:FIGL1 N-terminal domain-containing protein n=1 Tax=Fraxinus pennsylvanica TaxID=56036 RepID=A0AAD1ZLH0_9LAMI|nr:unnamed protein product [Fraxinus pennsylvanica]